MGLVERWRATRANFKPRDVEEAIDFYVHRPLAGLLVQIIADSPVTPNQVTVASGIASFLAGLFVVLSIFYAPWLAAVGGVLLFVSVILDCADGQLARLRKTSSPVGRALDGLVDSVAPLSVMPATVFVLLYAGYGHAWVWPIGWAAGLSLLWHSQLYDVSKNLYLHASRPDFSLGGNTLSLPEEMKAHQATMEAEGKRFDALIMKVWVGWTTPQLKTLRPWAAEERTPRDEGERELYRSLFRPVMAATTWLGFGLHLFILYTSLLVTPWWPEAIWVSWAIIAGPLNLVAFWVVLARRRAEGVFLDQLAAGRAQPDDPRSDPPAA